MRIRTWPLIPVVAGITALTFMDTSFERSLILITAFMLLILATVLDGVVVYTNKVNKILVWYANHLHIKIDAKSDPMPEELATLIEKEEDSPSG